MLQMINTLTHEVCSVHYKSQRQLRNVRRFKQRQYHNVTSYQCLKSPIINQQMYFL